MTRPLVNLQASWWDHDSLRSGSATVIIPTRITNNEDVTIYPAGTYWSGPLSTTVDGASLDVDVPATDDPEMAQTDWYLRVVVRFPNARSETYDIEVPYANRSVDDGGNGDGINLRDYTLPTQLPASDPSYAVGVAGGLAQLNAAGQVIDAAGNVITGGEDAEASVLSVNAQTGTVVLDKDDLGLGNVDNTSDANKPVSTATSTALAGKASSSHNHAASEITSGTLAVTRIGSGTAAAGKYVDGGTGAWTTLPEGGKGATDITNVVGLYPLPEMGLAAASFHPDLATNQGSTDSEAIRIAVAPGWTITGAKTHLHASTADESAGLNGFALYDDTSPGALITSTSSGPYWETTGWISHAFASPVAASDDWQFFWLCYSVALTSGEVSINWRDRGVASYWNSAGAKRRALSGMAGTFGSSWPSTINFASAGSAQNWLPMMGLTGTRA